MSTEYSGPERRESGGDRRQRRRVTDRRSGLDRRRGPGRRRGEIRKAAEEGEITGELFEFVMAIDEYKQINNKPFPSWSEIFEIMQYLGYRKVAPRAQHVNASTAAPAAPPSPTTAGLPTTVPVSTDDGG